MRYRLMLCAMTASLLLGTAALARTLTPVTGKILRQGVDQGQVTVRFPGIRKGTPVLVTVQRVNRDGEPTNNLASTLNAVVGPRGVFTTSLDYHFRNENLVVKATPLSRSEKVALGIPVKHREGPPALVASRTLKAMTQQLLPFDRSYTGSGMKLTLRAFLRPGDFRRLENGLKGSLRTAFTQMTKGKDLETEMYRNQVVLQEVRWNAQGQQGIAYRVATKSRSTFAGVSLGLPESGGSDLSFGLPK
jgi:hypothetical protein